MNSLMKETLAILEGAGYAVTVLDTDSFEVRGAGEQATVFFDKGIKAVIGGRRRSYRYPWGVEIALTKYIEAN